VAEAVDGEPDCLAPDDPTVVEKISVFNFSLAFTTQFVIDAAESLPIPDACGDLIDCCAAIAEDYRRFQCETLVKDPVRAATRCPSVFSSYAPHCPDIGGGGAGGSGGAGTEGGSAGSSGSLTTHAYCCYRACGYTHLT